MIERLQIERREEEGLGEEEEFGGRGRVKENILRTTANHDSMQVITVAGYSYVSCVDVSKCFICCDEDVSGSVLIINVIIAGRKEEGGWREGGGREGGWEEGGWEEGGGREGGGGWEDGMLYTVVYYVILCYTVVYYCMLTATTDSHWGCGVLWVRTG